MNTTVTRHNGSTFLAAWECWLGASTLACEFTGTAWTWYVEAFFSNAAMRRYQLLGQMIACLAILAFLAGKLTRLHLQPRIDAFCQRSQEPKTQLYSVLPMEDSRVHEAELPEKNDPQTITALPNTYQELKALAKALGHPKPHMTKKTDLIDWIQSNQA